MKKILSGAWLCLAPFFCTAQLSVAGIFNDNMILQQNAKNNIWGKATAGNTVNVIFRNIKYSCKTNVDGNWTLKIDAGKAGKAGDLIISTASEKTIFKNILVGEIWLCSGQSNMDLTLNEFKDVYKDEINTAKNDNIRYAVIEKKVDNRENKNVMLRKKWTAINPISVVECSAVGYFYAKKLYERLHIPIGLINVAWSGTPAQAWVDSNTLNGFEAYKKIYENEISKINFTTLDITKTQNEELFKTDKKESTVQFQKNLETGFDDSKWQHTTLPKSWEESGLAKVDGIGAYRILFEMPTGVSLKNAMLKLPAIDDEDSTFVNGKFIGTTNVWNKKRVYSIADGILKEGKNIINIWVNDTGGGGGFESDTAHFFVEAGNKKYQLQGDAKFILLAQKKLLFNSINEYDLQNQPSVLFDAMIAPLLPYTFKGVIWYQGESNADNYIEYRSLFPALIKNWRSRFSNGEFPFLYAQLSSYNPGGKEPEISNWAFLREAQTMTLALPKTGMAVTTDIGDLLDIHPKKKKQVGERLASLAFKNVYGFTKETASGAMYKKSTIIGKSIIISFTGVEKGFLKTNKKLEGFTIAEANKKFISAHAVIKGKQIIVSTSLLKNPLYVRYAWANAPMNANLYNTEGFPVVPFRTDK